MNKLTHFQYDGHDLLVEYVETQTVKEGVECDVYSFKNDTTKDLAIVRVKAGYSTPLQRIVSGDETLEGFVSGEARLSVIKQNGDVEAYEFPASKKAVKVAIGDQMQWTAQEDLVFYEVCTPPYEDGRFEDLA